MDWIYDTEDKILVDKLTNLTNKGIVTKAEFNAKIKSINEKYQESFDKFQNFLKMGILTQEEYNKSISKIVKNPPQSSEPVKVNNDTSNLSEEQEKLDKLASLLEKGVLTREEYDHSVSKITGVLPPSNSQYSQCNSQYSSEDQAKLDKLKDFLDKGILSKEEYDHSVSKITGELVVSKQAVQEAPKQTSEVKKTQISGLDEEKQAKLDKLNGLLEKGVLTQKEYDYSVSKLK